MKQKEILLALAWYNHYVNVGVTRYAQKHNWFLNCYCLHNSAPPENWHGDGIITMCGGDERLMDFVEKQSARVPVVSLSNANPELNYGRVLEDNIAIGKLGAMHFIDNQFDQIAFFRNHNSWSGNLRQEAFYQQAKARNIDIIDFDFLADTQEAADFQPQQTWLINRLKKLNRPLGIMALNDEQAIQILLATQKASIKIPSQVAVLGVDDSPLAGELAPIPLSSIKTTPEKQGYLAAELLDALIAGQPIPKEPIIIPPKSLVIRQSSDTLAVDDSRIAKAIDFIRNNFPKNISMEDVARAVSMSRRRLHDLFMQNTSHSVHDHIVQRRVNYACKLLKTTDWSVKKIAFQSGFTSSVHMCQTFARELSATPSQIRKKNC